MTTPDQFLAASRREFSIAKRWKSYQWRVDVAASLIALAAAAVPFRRLSPSASWSWPPWPGSVRGSPSCVRDHASESRNGLVGTISSGGLLGGRSRTTSMPISYCRFRAKPVSSAEADRLQLMGHFENGGRPVPERCAAPICENPFLVQEVARRYGEATRTARFLCVECCDCDHARGPRRAMGRWASDPCQGRGCHGDHAGIPRCLRGVDCLPAKQQRVGCHRESFDRASKGAADYEGPGTSIPDRLLVPTLRRANGSRQDLREAST